MRNESPLGLTATESPDTSLLRKLLHFWITQNFRARSATAIFFYLFIFFQNVKKFFEAPTKFWRKVFRCFQCTPTPIFVLFENRVYVTPTDNPCPPRLQDPSCIPVGSDAHPLNHASRSQQRTCYHSVTRQFQVRKHFLHTLTLQTRLGSMTRNTYNLQVVQHRLPAQVTRLFVITRLSLKPTRTPNKMGSGGAVKVPPAGGGTALVQSRAFS